MAGSRCFNDPIRGIQKRSRTSDFSVDENYKGFLQVFNQEHFKNRTLGPRLGTKHDGKSLINTFQRFNFEVDYRTDLELNDIEEKVEELKQKDFSNYDCIFIVILTHGFENNVLAASDANYPLFETIISPIHENPSLGDKPKVFLIQACRGQKEHTHDGDSKIRNTLICFSSEEGYASYRDREQGTPFIQCICSDFEKEGTHKSILDILKGTKAKLDHHRNIKNNVAYKQIMDIENYDFKRNIILGKI